MKDCYRTYHDLRALLRDLLWMNSDCVATFHDAAEHIAQYLVDNGYEISKYEIAGEDVPEGERFEGPYIKPIYINEEVLEARKKRGEIRESLDTSELFMPPVKKSLADGIAEKGGRGFDELDRCPEDILREEIETEGGE